MTLREMLLVLRGRPGEAAGSAAPSDPRVADLEWTTTDSPEQRRARLERLKRSAAQRADG